MAYTLTNPSNQFSLSAGKFYRAFSDLQSDVNECFGRNFPFMRGGFEIWDYTCWKANVGPWGPVARDDNGWNGWNEFEGVKNWDMRRWNLSRDFLPNTKVIHECGHRDAFEDMFNRFPHHRWVFGKVVDHHLMVRSVQIKYVFLGLYQMDEEQSKSYSESNPYAAANGPSVDFPHFVWKRVDGDWKTKSARGEEIFWKGAREENNQIATPEF